MSLRCDGRDVVDDAVAEVLHRPAEGIHRLEVTTGTKAAVVADAMTRASDSLEQSTALGQQAAEFFMEGKTVEGVEVLGECARFWQQIHHALEHSIRMLNLDAQAVHVGGLSLHEVLDQPKDVLLQIKQALLSKNHEMLADVLQYEFSDASAMWFTVITHLRQEARGKF